ncbi:MAG: methionine synthase, partial [Veillonella sp.]|nr:methionine synthase [Veillonella sp.]
VKGRIKDAEQYVSKDQLCLSPQCGFSSTEEGNELLDEDQWKKLALIKKIAEDVWEDA